MKRAARLLRVSVVVALLAGPRLPVLAAGASSHEPPLAGPWRAVSMIRGGKPVPAREVRNLLFLFGEKNLTVRLGAKLLADSSYTVGQSAEPGQLDIEFDGVKTLGVYRIAKGALTLRANEPGRGRPKDLDAPSDVKLLLRRADRSFSYMHVMDADGANQRILVEHPEFTTVGSPEWSRDGRRLVFDAWRSIYQEGSRQAHVLTCNADGSGLTDLGRGAMPSWSPDGKRIAYSSYDPRGVWTMNADGTDRKLIDAEGWAIEWCPVGNRVAYTTYDAGSANVRVRDLATGKARDLLGDRYFYIYYGMSWSPDGQWIALLGRKRDASYELAIVHVDGRKKGFRVLAPTGESKGFRPLANVCWNPDGRQVLVPLRKSSNPWALYTINVDAPHETRRLAGQSDDRAYDNPAWSPDGKKIAFRATKSP